MAKKVLYIDMDGVIADFEGVFDLLDPAVLEEYAGRRSEIPALFSVIQPLPGAIEAVTELAGLYDTYVLSTVPWNNTTGASQKVEWIQRHFGREPGTPLWKRVILTHHKHLNRGDFLIDDRPDRSGAALFAETNPGGATLHFGGPDFPDWAAVLDYLRERAGAHAVAP